MMKYFGTDGIRGKVNDFLTDQIAYKIGRYLGYQAMNENSKIIIGHDTRISAKMLESSLVAGITTSGCDVDLVGVITTPGLAFLTQAFNYEYGIMISASHNPYYDNGLKIFNQSGHKIDEFLMLEIEGYLHNDIKLPRAVGANIGSYQIREELLDYYKNYIRIILNVDLSEYKILIDAANGSGAYTVDIIESLGAKVTVVNNEPNGCNINDGCGSTYVEKLPALMREGKFDFGFSLDGDADRVILLDENGSIVDGDVIMYLAANYFKERDLLYNNKVVCTKMSNIGLLKALKNKDIDYVITDVGDSNVFEKMRQDGLIVGGEKSGHVILSHLSIMSDGLISALLVLKIMTEKNQTLSEITKDIHLFPQKLVNLETNQAKKLLKKEAMINICQDVENELGEDGRVLVRASGTEPLLRVMVEADTMEKCDTYTNEIIRVAETLI